MHTSNVFSRRSDSSFHKRKLNRSKDCTTALRGRERKGLRIPNEIGNMNGKKKHPNVRRPKQVPEGSTRSIESRDKFLRVFETLWRFYNRTSRSKSQLV